MSTADTADVAEVVAEVVADHLPVADDDTWRTAPLVDSGLDSMEVVELVIEIEDRLGVAFPDELLVRETFETLTSLTTAVQRLAGATGLATASDPGP